MSKKHENLIKISNNKKSLVNLKTFLNSLTNYYEKITNSKNFQKSEENLLLKQTIEDSLNTIKEELNLPDEELIEKINNLQIIDKFSPNSNSKSLKFTLINHQKFVKNYSSLEENDFKQNKINNRIEIKNSNTSNTKYLRSKSPQFSLSKILPPIISKTNKDKSPIYYNGVFKKYEYFVSAEKSNNKSIKILGSNFKTVKNSLNIKINKNAEKSNNSAGDGKIFFFYNF